jgi:hypothetical protein
LAELGRENVPFSLRSRIIEIDDAPRILDEVPPVIRLSKAEIGDYTGGIKSLFLHVFGSVKIPEGERCELSVFGREIPVEPFTAKALQALLKVGVSRNPNVVSAAGKLFKELVKGAESGLTGADLISKLPASDYFGEQLAAGLREAAPC